MKRFTLFLVALAAVIGSPPAAVAVPYTFTQSDYIEYWIWFSPRGSTLLRDPKLLHLRFGDAKGFNAKYFPSIKNVPGRKQQLRLSTPRGSIWISRNDNEGLTIVRDTYQAAGGGGTKLLDVRFEGARCRDAQGTVSTCSVTLLLTTDGPDKGVKRQSRTLKISTSTGLSFRYKSVASDGGKPLNRRLLNRTPVINNYAWDWRPGEG